jgi:Holliday junction resolvase RusA-like endonuclease
VLQCKYIVPGDFSHFISFFGHKKRIWDIVSEFKTRFSIELTNQHNNVLFTGPVHITTAFYFPYPRYSTKYRHLDQVLHTDRPCMSALIYFIEHVSLGILFDNSCIISALNCSKLYVKNNPRIEIEITSLKNDSIDFSPHDKERD